MILTLGPLDCTVDKGLTIACNKEKMSRYFHYDQPDVFRLICMILSRLKHNWKLEEEEKEDQLKYMSVGQSMRSQWKDDEE